MGALRGAASLVPVWVYAAAVAAAIGCGVTWHFAEIERVRKEVNASWQQLADQAETQREMKDAAHAADLEKARDRSLADAVAVNAADARVAGLADRLRAAAKARCVAAPAAAASAGGHGPAAEAWDVLATCGERYREMGRDAEALALRLTEAQAYIVSAGAACGTR